MDQQKFEITVETGCWKGAGSTAKVGCYGNLNPIDFVWCNDLKLSICNCK